MTSRSLTHLAENSVEAIRLINDKATLLGYRVNTLTVRPDLSVAVNADLRTLEADGHDLADLVRAYLLAFNYDDAAELDLWISGQFVPSQQVR